MIKTVLFDWNGTLLDDVLVNMQATNTMLEKRNMKQMSGLEEYRNRFCFPVINYYIDLGFDFDKEPFEVLSVEFINEYDSHFNECKLMDGATELIEYLHSNKITCNILSASRQENLLRQVRGLNCEHLFDEILGISNIYAASKVETAKKWIESTDRNPEEILMIGDSLHDAEVAKVMGVHCALVSCGHQSVDVLSQAGVPIVGNLTDIKELINEFK